MPVWGKIAVFAIGIIFIWNGIKNPQNDQRIRSIALGIIFIGLEIFILFFHKN